MKYYVIINGESSLDIEGLAIESLPAISKPLMRSKQETIDGRDGDIITQLGFSAYDKTLKIGLWGNYDIDEIISYFNQDGIITFSNEPDMYYNFTILNRIDFINQLEAFRKATITIHCQPFKYKEEETETLELVEHQEDGTSLNLEDTIEAPMQIDLKGNTSQVQLNGKNLFNDYNKTSSNICGIAYSFTNNEILINGTYDQTGNWNAWLTASNNGNASNDMALLNANTTYTISIYVISGTTTNSNNQLYISSRDSNKTNFTWNYKLATFDSSTQRYKVSFTTTDSVYISGIRYSISPSNTAVFNNLKLKIQIEQNNTSTDFEQYCGGTPSPNPSYPQDIHNVSGNNQVVISNGASDTTTYPINLPVQGYNTPNLYDPTTAPVIDGCMAVKSVMKLHGVSLTKIKTTYMACNQNTKYLITKTLGGTNYFDVGTTTNTPAINGSLNQCEDAITETSYEITTGANDNYIVVSYWQDSETGDTKGSITIKEYSTKKEELSKIGTYQDYIYKENDKWYLHKEIGKVVFDGSENKFTQIYTTNTSGVNRYRTNVVGVKIQTSGQIANVYCDKLLPTTIGYTYSKTEGISVSDAVEMFIIYIDEIKSYTLENANAWLSTNNLTINYVLATPTNTEITDSTLLSQLEAIYNAKSKNGTTNINQVNNDEMFILGVDYFTGTDNITITNHGNYYSKPKLTLTGTGNIGIYLNDNQIFQVALGTNETIIIDTDKMEAYYESTLKNRQVIGDYNSFKLLSGENTIKISGTFSKLQVDNYSRWI